MLLQDEQTGELLTARRIVHPQPDWWFLGGRMRAGETPAQAARKNVKRETGLDLEQERLTCVCTASLLWQMRKQVPADNGTADIQIVFTAKVTPEERQSIQWDDGEYDAVKWVPPSELVEGAQYHPALRRAAAHVLAVRQAQRLEVLVRSAASDAEVAAAARAYIQQQDVARAMAELPVPFKDIPVAPLQNGT